MEDPDPGSQEARPRTDHVTDGSLLRRFRAGQPDAATELYERYAHKLRALAAAHLGKDLGPRLDAEDVLQSVFRTFFRRAERGEYDLPDGNNLWKLLFVIGLNKIRSKGAHHRAEMRDVRATTGGSAAESALTGLSAADETALTELRLTIEEILGTLPASQRAIIELRMDGDKVEEIAAKTGRSKRTVERAIHEFCGVLKEILGSTGPAGPKTGS
jgi:RNA polymerase sigma-70 factor (ECF subfamily)